MCCRCIYMIGLPVSIFANKSDISIIFQVIKLLRSKLYVCMKGKHLGNQSYLDITEYLLKEHSPCFKPKIPDHCQVSLSPMCMTPEVSPIMEAVDISLKTPVRRASKELGSPMFKIPELDDFHDFCLEGRSIKETKSKKIKKYTSTPKFHSTWHFADCDLQHILNSTSKNDEIVESSSIDEEFSDDDQFNFKLEASHEYAEEEGKQLELERQSTTHFDMLTQEPLYLEWHHTNPKKELINKIKYVCSSEELKSDQEKLEIVKAIIGNYIFDFEKFYFEESMNSLNGSISSILTTLTNGIDQTFRKNIGGLSFQKRRLKLVKYLEKKKRRVWQKKVNYDCRKKVADGRLRIKGKFVTYEQALEQLGMGSLEGYNADEIRNMLEKQIDSGR